MPGELPRGKTARDLGMWKSRLMKLGVVFADYTSSKVRIIPTLIWLPSLDSPYWQLLICFELASEHFRSGSERETACWDKCDEATDDQHGGMTGN